MVYRKREKREAALGNIKFFFQNTMKQGTSVKFFELKKKW